MRSTTNHKPLPILSLSPAVKEGRKEGREKRIGSGLRERPWSTLHQVSFIRSIEVQVFLFRPIIDKINLFAGGRCIMLVSYADPRGSGYETITSLPLYQHVTFN